MEERLGNTPFQPTRADSFEPRRSLALLALRFFALRLEDVPVDEDCKRSVNNAVNQSLLLLSSL